MAFQKYISEISMFFQEESTNKDKEYVYKCFLDFVFQSKDILEMTDREILHQISVYFDNLDIGDLHTFFTQFIENIVRPLFFSTTQFSTSFSIKGQGENTHSQLKIFSQNNAAFADFILKFPCNYEERIRKIIDIFFYYIGENYSQEDIKKIFSHMGMDVLKFQELTGEHYFLLFKSGKIIQKIILHFMDFMEYAFDPKDFFSGESLSPDDTLFQMRYLLVARNGFQDHKELFFRSLIDYIVSANFNGDGELQEYLVQILVSFILQIQKKSQDFDIGAVEQHVYFKKAFSGEYFIIGQQILKQLYNEIYVDSVTAGEIIPFPYQKVISA